MGGVDRDTVARVEFAESMVDSAGDDILADTGDLIKVAGQVFKFGFIKLSSFVSIRAGFLDFILFGSFAYNPKV
jgi:hypothetical protein